MGRLKSPLGSALACDECGLQRPDMTCAHSIHVTTPTLWHFVVLFLPGCEVNMTCLGQFLLPNFWHFQLGSYQVLPGGVKSFAF